MAARWKPMPVNRDRRVGAYAGHGAMVASRVRPAVGSTDTTPAGSSAASDAGADDWDAAVTTLEGSGERAGGADACACCCGNLMHPDASADAASSASIARSNVTDDVRFRVWARLIGA